MLPFVSLQKELFGVSKWQTCSEVGVFNLTEMEFLNYSSSLEIWSKVPRLLSLSIQ